jgi:hypothetical protein
MSEYIEQGDNHNEKENDWTIYVIGLIIMVIFLLSSCRTIEYVPIEKIVTKDSIITRTEYVNKETKVKEYVVGDTVYRDSIVFCTILHSDTLYVHTNDTTTVVKEVEVIKEVERSLNWYEKTMIRLGWALIAFVVAIVGWKVLKWYFKR